MKIELAYGKSNLTIDLPDEANITVVQPKHFAGVADPVVEIRTALQKPIGARPLPGLVGATDTVGIVFSDITRPTPNHLIIPAIRAELSHVPDKQIILFNATGTHRFNTDAELRAMLGDEVVERYRIVQNDSSDKGSHRIVGTTSSGNDIEILKQFLDCDVRILTGFIEPHLFAGFSGGGKAVMPGLASLETIQRNHSAANMDSPAARWGITKGNPLWEEIYESGMMVEPTFLVNVTLNRHKEITAVFAGDFSQAHEQGCTFVKQTAMAPVSAPFDIIICTNSGYPLDLNLYQAVKGMSAASQIVKEGGSIIIAASCWDGIPAHGEYGRLLREAEGLDKLLATLRAPGFACQDMWMAHIHALVGKRADVYLYSENLSEEEIRRAMLSPCRNIEQTLAQLLERYGAEATVCVMPEGPQTVPFVPALSQAAKSTVN